MYQDFGRAYLLGLLLALLFLCVALAVAVALVVLSLRYARRGGSLVALAFPVSLPLLGIVCAALVDVPSWWHYRAVKPVWVGLCTLAAVLIMARALWLRPAADKFDADVRRQRQWEIAATALGAGLVYFLWLAAGLLFEQQAAEKRAIHVEQESAAGAAWGEGRIVATARALGYSPDGRDLAVADTHLQIWDLTTGRVHRTWPIQVGNVNAIPNLFGFDGSGTRLALSVSPVIEVFDLAGDRLRLTWTRSLRWSEHGCQVRFLDRQGVLVVLDEGKAKGFSSQTGQAAELSIAALQVPDITALAVSSDGAHLATWSHTRKRVAAWTISASEPSWSADDVEAGGRISFAYSPDNRWLGLATRDKQIVVWNASIGAELLRLEAGRQIGHFAFSPDGAQIVALTTQSASSTAAPQVHIWSLPDGQNVVTLGLPVASGAFMALSHDAREVAIVDTQSGSFPSLPATVRRFATATGVEHFGFAAGAP